MIPMKDKVGKHKVILKVSDGKRVYRKTKEIEVIQSDIRSIQQISGAWTGIYHWSEEEGKHWNQDIKKMTDDHWREMIRSMHKIEMDMVVIQEVFRHQAYIGSSTTVEDYPGRLSILLNYIPAVWTLQLKILSKPFSRKRISKECKY